ncbi:MAG: HAD hydrolase family protein [Candidatus Cellulosilyticum pullistercoris]|uniref:HAD hydrolase family protein n=1 Tax=Candidatus Cellulosilyticum pullistercoris TaxID=2838521 RepID=A0A9E2KD92_9FIRM|nr:HAD hydrolase family protein [Candidatus Cellulosilyticum pullistercoris]
MSRKRKSLPPIGMRMIKSAVGVFLALVIYLLRGRQGAPFYTAISVLWCMQPYNSDARKNALQRTIGTIIGAVYGLIVIIIEYYLFPTPYEIVRYLLISLFIIPVLYTTVICNKKNASYFSCVVFLSITIVHITDANPYLFVFNRFLDTMIGIGLALLINSVRIPRKRRTDCLFVLELDDVLLKIQETMTSYSKIELNKMIDSGAKFTIATMRPPAALIPALQGIRIKLPVVAMDGAVLYDINENRFLKKYAMTYEEMETFVDFFHERDFHCFINVIIEDSVAIYYQEFKNPIEQKIYKQLRSSPYRNYIKGNPTKQGDTVYLMLIDTEERIEYLYKELKEAAYTESHKIIKYASNDYPGYMYIKVYNKEASKKNMIQHIQQKIELKEIVTLGEVEGIGNNRIEGKDCNEIVRNFKKVYEPYFWK